MRSLKNWGLKNELQQQQNIVIINILKVWSNVRSFSWISLNFLSFLLPVQIQRASEFRPYFGSRYIYWNTI